VRDVLAERLLAEVMDWTPQDVARERPALQAMATHKYDDYAQFAPGKRFVESLALWLSQFAAERERQIAYNFVRERLVFCSSAEMTHLVQIAYADHIRPFLLRQAAQQLGVSDARVAQVARSLEYRELQRRTLFLGLSDGARMDVLRRSHDELNHEQVWPTYSMSKDQAQAMVDELRKGVAHLREQDPREEDVYFRVVFLLDDFSGSGISYLTVGNAPHPEPSGKLARFCSSLQNSEEGVSQLVRTADLRICVVLYMATDQARAHIQDALARLNGPHSVQAEVMVVMPVASSIRLQDANPRDLDFLAIADKYYDEAAENEHTQKGGGSVARGFAGCALPLVLHHNTPNNSVFLLWADPQRYRIRGLFPRVERHRSEA